MSVLNSGFQPFPGRFPNFAAIQGNPTIGGLGGPIGLQMGIQGIPFNGGFGSPIQFQTGPFGNGIQSPPFGGQRPDPQLLLNMADGNGDGSLSQQEFLNFTPPAPPFANGQQLPTPTTEMKQQIFAKIDANSDGQISAQELQSAPPPPLPPGLGGFRGVGGPFAGQRPDPQQMISKMDTDGNGAVSQQEFLNFTPPAPPFANGQQLPTPTTEMKQQIFAKIDANGDGQITSEELQAAKPPGMGGGPRLSPEEKFAKIDANSDGGITQAEFEAFKPPAPPFLNGQQLPEPTAEMKQQMFAKLDGNGDGVITLQEMQAARPPRPPQFSGAGPFGNGFGFQGPSIPGGSPFAPLLNGVSGLSGNFNPFGQIQLFNPGSLVSG